MIGKLLPPREVAYFPVCSFIYASKTHTPDGLRGPWGQMEKLNSGEKRTMEGRGSYTNPKRRVDGL